MYVDTVFASFFLGREAGMKNIFEIEREFPKEGRGGWGERKGKRSEFKKSKSLDLGAC